MKTYTVAALSLVYFTCNVSSFIPNTNLAFRLASTNKNNPTNLHGYIESDTEEEIFDPKAGGVGLAMENAICVSGTVDKKGMAIAKEMKRYTKVIKMSDSGATVICKGDGAEIYKDPGLSTEKIITLAPKSAVEDALGAIENDASSQDGKIYITFSGGDDLMMHEVLDGVQQMVSGLGISSSKVEFRSLCEPSFPMERCGVAAVVVDGASTGQVYYNDGSWYTISEDDANQAME